MKKVKRLIELKRQTQLAEKRYQRARDRLAQLGTERSKVLSSFTTDEKRLYKEQIERACIWVKS